MRRIIELAVQNPVAMNLMMVVILMVGLYSQAQLPRENFPNFSLDRITITVPYIGASPEEVEESLCIKIEEAIDGIDGIKRIDSEAEEGVGAVIVQLHPDTDARRALSDIEQAIDRITTFPEDADDPAVKELLLRSRVLEIVLCGDASERVIKECARDIRDELLKIRELSQVQLLGVRNYEIAIELDESQLRAYNLTFEQVAKIVTQSSLNLPAGSIRTESEEYIVRAFGQRYDGRAFEDIVLLSQTDGTALRLRDVAKVSDKFEEKPILMKVGDDKAVMMLVSKTVDQNAIKISEEISSYIEMKNRELPEGLKLILWSNETRHIVSRLELLKRNGWMGLALVFLSLWMFLELRLAFWVAWGIPVSFAGALIIFSWSGQSLNLISAFGLIMALGIIVDDAIVVGENIFAHQNMGKDPYTACIDGTAEVAIPVVASTLTTAAAFMPLFMVSGVMGKFIAVLPLAMLSCLMVSLVESMLILPVHLRHKETRRAQEPGFFKRTAQKFRDFMTWLFDSAVEKLYRPILRLSLNYRPVTFCIFTSVLLISAGMFLGGHVTTNLFPKDDSENYIARLRLSAGTPVARTREKLVRIETAAERLNEVFREQNAGKDVITKVFTVAGEWSGLPPEYGSHFGEVQIELSPSEQRKVGSQKILNRWRELVGQIPEAVSMVFKTKDIQPGGAPVEILLLGDDFKALRGAADELKDILGTYAGVFDIEDNLRPGKREFRISLTEKGRTTGLTLADVSQQIRGAFYGSEARRIQRGRDEIKVKVRFSESERGRVKQLTDMLIRTPQGHRVPLSEIADLRLERGYNTIRRLNRQRRVTVMADVDEAEQKPAAVMSDVISNVLPGLCKRHGIQYSLEGQAKESQESIASLGPGFVLALFLIYCILAILFRSYLQPFIIMTAIPFGIVGVILGHWVFNLDLTLMSLFGAVALAGIVVNDALVLVDFINRAVAKGSNAREACESAGVSRFRAIMLTSLTTVAGLFPLVTETSRQAKYIIPMAVTISAGLAFATFINLILVPALYCLLVDVNKCFVWLYTGVWPETLAVEDQPAQATDVSATLSPVTTSESH